jgi:uncharacterized OsmC-like protein
MAEIVVVRQNSQFETEFLAADTEAAEPAGRELKPVHAIHELSPYGMLLAGLGSCTAILLHSYAQNHGVKLEWVEMRLTYDRVFAKDCQQCEEIEQYTEQIKAEVGLVGKLSAAERNKLFLISKHCPVHKILHNGIQTEFVLAKTPDQTEPTETTS